MLWNAGFLSDMENAIFFKRAQYPSSYKISSSLMQLVPMVGSVADSHLVVHPSCWSQSHEENIRHECPRQRMLRRLVLLAVVSAQHKFPLQQRIRAQRRSAHLLVPKGLGIGYIYS